MGKARSVDLWDPHASERTHGFYMLSAFYHVVSKIFAGHRDRDEIGRAEDWNPAQAIIIPEGNDDD
jgi:hypothetical protein